MIYGHLASIEKELALYPQAIREGLAYLARTELTGLANGKHAIDGDRMYVILSEYTPDVAANRKAETHEKYIDIQYIIQGEELMGFSPAGSGEVSENLLAEKDAIFYKNVKNETFLRVNSGMFAVFFPWDIHRPGCVTETAAPVRKAVLKIAMSAL